MLKKWFLIATSVAGLLWFKNNNQSSIINHQTVVREENAVIDVVDRVGPSVVTVGIDRKSVV